MYSSGKLLEVSSFQEASYHGQKIFNGTPFLQMFVPNNNQKSLDALLDLIKDNNKWLKDQLVDSGAILFKGWDVKDGKDFSAVVEAFGFKTMPYAQGEARRKHIHGKVLSANALPPEYELPFHSEMAYLAPEYPDVIMFFCETPSSQGGGTAFARGDVIYKKMVERMPEFVDKLEKEGIVYTYVPQKGWQDTFDTTDPAVAQERARAVNARLEWGDNGEAKVHRGPFPPTLKHPVKNTIGWFNSLNLPFNKSYGDGAGIPTEDIQACLNISREDQVIVQWEKGDIVVADNLGVMHAKLPGAQGPRAIYVTLCKI